MRTSIALVLIAGSVQASADIVTDVERRLGRHDVTTGAFTQTAEVAALREPVVSAGRFRVDRESGFVWHVERPIATEFRMSLDGSDASATDPTLRWIASIIDASLSGDIDALTAVFAIDGAVDSDEWRIFLTPRARAARRAVARIEVAGDEAVRSVRIDQANGDAISIEFSDIAHPARSDPGNAP